MKTDLGSKLFVPRRAMEGRLVEDATVVGREVAEYEVTEGEGVGLVGWEIATGEGVLGQETGEEWLVFPGARVGEEEAAVEEDDDNGREWGLMEEEEEEDEEEEAVGDDIESNKFRR